MFCSKCGVQNDAEAKFCKDCGNSLDTAPSTKGKVPVFDNVSNNAVKPKSLLLYALAPVGLFIALIVLWGIINVFADTENPSAFIEFFNNVIIPLLFAFTFLAIPFGIIYAIYSNSKTFDGSIKCGNCAYVGEGKKGRSVWAQVLVWLLFLFFWPITLVYYLVTHSYLCPKCGSTFVGLRDKNGHYSAPSGGAGPLVIVIAVILVIAIIGILAAVVLASLNDARDKGQDAATMSNLSSLMAEAELYYKSNSNYSNLCNNFRVDKLLAAAGANCNDSTLSYAASAPLNEGGYFCVDSQGSTLTSQLSLGTRTACPSGTSVGSATSGNSSSRTIHEDLKEAEEYANSIFQLPVMIDEETRMDRIYASRDNKMNYDYTLINYMSYELEWSELDSLIRPILENSFCNDSSFEYYRTENIPMKWNYYGNDRNIIGSIELSRSNCY
jgi:type II secretory pathway pseudopilin PulG